MSAGCANAPSGVGSSPTSTFSAAAWRPSTEWIESAAARISGRFDVRRLAEVGRGAEVLDRGRELQHLGRVLERELRHRGLRDRPAELLRGRGKRVDVLLLDLADALDQRQVVALEQSALGDVVVERGLEVLERQRVVDDPEVALAELRGRVLRAGRHRARAGRRLVVGPPHAASNAPAAPVPPVRAKNLRRETGSRAMRFTALGSVRWEMLICELPWLVTGERLAPRLLGPTYERPQGLDQREVSCGGQRRQAARQATNRASSARRRRWSAPPRPLPGRR